MSAPGFPGGPLRRHRALDAVWANPGGLGRLTIVNHTVVGKRFLFTSFFFFLVGGVLAMLIRAQLATSDNDFLGYETYNQVFTMHGTVMMFLFAIPAIEGLALYLLPKMLGARDLAFPRLSAFGYFCYLFGGLILLGALLAGVAPRDGWFMYTPLSGRAYSPGVNADVWLIGVTFVEISAVAIGVELMATILKLRAAGMSLQRMPILAWAMLVTAAMILIGFPPLILASILLEMERAFGWPFFDAERGGSPLLWQHLFWLFGHPEVYIIFLPGAAIVSTLVPAFARHPLVGYTAVVAALIATGFLSFGLWVHHMYTVGIPHMALVFFSAASMLVVIPTTVQFGSWFATMWAGRPVLRLPMLYLAGFLFIFVLGGLTGIMLALVPFDWQVHDTHFVVAHLHYVLIGGFVFPLLAGAYYWMPHMTGRMPSERLGRIAFWLIFLGFNLTFLIMHLTGLMGMTRRVYTYHPAFGWDLFNTISSVGGFVMSAGFAAFLLDVVLHARHGRLAGRDPWGAGTLEWAMPTPPPLYNFASLPEVHSRDPLWDSPAVAAEMAGGRHHLALARNGWQETLGVDAVSGRPAYVILLPGPSWLPFLGAAAMGVFFLGFLLQQYAAASIGAALATGLFTAWAWDNGLRHDPEPVEAGRGAILPLHAATGDPPGRWGTWFTLTADGTMLASLLFGYLFLWTVAPGWPPPALIDPGWGWAALAVAGSLAGAPLAHLAFARLRTAGARACVAPLGVAAAAGLVAAAAFLAVPLTMIESPRAHAYDATVTVLALYAAFHAALCALISGHVAARCLAGYVSPLRRADVVIARMWWTYTAAANLLVALAVFVLPMVPAR